MPRVLIEYREISARALAFIALGEGPRSSSHRELFPELTIYLAPMIHSSMASSYPTRIYINLQCIRFWRIFGSIFVLHPQSWQLMVLGSNAQTKGYLVRQGYNETLTCGTNITVSLETEHSVTKSTAGQSCRKFFPGRTAIDTAARGNMKNTKDSHPPT